MKYLYAILASLILIGCAGNNADTGRVVFGITDAAADMGTVTNVKITIDSIKVRAENDNWVTVSSSQQTYDLLELKAQGATALLVDAQIPNGTYTETRLEISKVIVTDAQGDHEAKLPSGELKLKGDIVVEGNSTSSAVFDFLADKSLHTTGNGQYVLAPVVKVETKQDTEVAVENGKIRVIGGTVRTSTTVGMDLNGNVGVDVSVPADAAVEIEGGMIKNVAKVDGKAKVGLNVTA
jgi:hypothetical protein